MNYCIQGIQNCCTNLSKCCDKICNDCCNKGCDKCCQCLSSVAESINNCFSLPFSFCTFITMFVVGIPFILMIAALTSNTFTTDTEYPVATFLIIIGFGNLLNLLFSVYLVCTFK